MIEIKARLRKWGDSYGIVVPTKFIKKENVKIGDSMEVLVKKERKDNILREMFGANNTKKSTDQILKELDEELWPNGE